MATSFPMLFVDKETDQLFIAESLDLGLKWYGDAGICGWLYDKDCGWITASHNIVTFGEHFEYLDDLRD